MVDLTPLQIFCRVSVPLIAMFLNVVVWLYIMGDSGFRKKVFSGVCKRLQRWYSLARWLVTGGGEIRDARQATQGPLTYSTEEFAETLRLIASTGVIIGSTRQIERAMHRLENMGTVVDDSPTTTRSEITTSVSAPPEAMEGSDEDGVVPKRKRIRVVRL